MRPILLLRLAGTEVVDHRPEPPASFFGRYIHSASSDDGFGDTAYHAWVDGRVVTGSPR